MIALNLQYHYYQQRFLNFVIYLLFVALLVDLESLKGDHPVLALELVHSFQLAHSDGDHVLVRGVRLVLVVLHDVLAAGLNDGKVPLLPAPCVGKQKRWKRRCKVC